MKAIVDEGNYTFSNHSDTNSNPSKKSEVPSSAAGPGNENRPKANPLWMKQNRPTLKLPESDSPRHSTDQGVGISPGVMNNVELIDHAFSTPTSATPLNSGYFSSGSERSPLLGLAGMSFFADKDREQMQFEDFRKIFDKISLTKGQDKMSLTPPDVRRSRLKKVSFDMQAIPSPLSAKPYHSYHGGSWDFRTNSSSVWENSLDNEEEIIANVRIQHDRNEALMAENDHRSLSHSVMSAYKLSGKMGVPRPHGGHSPHSATVPSVGRSFPPTWNSGPRVVTNQVNPGPPMKAQMTHGRGHSMEEQTNLAMHEAHYAASQEHGPSPFPMIINDSVRENGMPADMVHGHMHLQDGQLNSPLLGEDRQDYAAHGNYRAPRLRASPKHTMPLTCFACRGVGHKATQCPTHPRPVVATSSTDVIVNCAVHGKPRTSKNMFFNNEMGVWQCFSETECKSMIN
ncbi:hypothetical protein XU18_2500 [Perkinsela sp. CCAP 1560/4]|nr:hypothetical protein XU18_2500 [Perkinsela sp. CCAP 1560/4]|eukprot:KNH06672.1 hypothetical protein XU18_2500 [Perkinsela sp. CCAP 1560/4]